MKINITTNNISVIYCKSRHCVGINDASHGLSLPEMCECHVQVTLVMVSLRLSDSVSDNKDML